MRYVFLSFLAFFITSCNENNKVTETDILDDLSIGLVEAWSESISKNHVPSFNYNIGDTVEVFYEIFLFKETTDTLISSYPDCPECYHKVPNGTKFRVTNLAEHTVNLETVFDNSSTIKKGFLPKDELLEAANPGIHSQRNRLLQYFENKRNELKARLMDKYGLTEDEFYRIVGAKYSEKTGNPGFSY
ncbi:hypothetical protein [Fulvivirga lutea]|uniref:Uncharacterized protein n=1 Tax=Fulvivirga lutea TaxID=2810512 RepID=A0A974WI52_9BACT|nr:hypothetical protein [Fulvivirga lutea]QSE98999.1 hypothetical protein JR347_07910 [Fulvivirga lutea]